PVTVPASSDSLVWLQWLVPHPEKNGPTGWERSGLKPSGIRRSAPALNGGTLQQSSWLQLPERFTRNLSAFSPPTSSTVINPEVGSWINLWSSKASSPEASASSNISSGSRSVRMRQAATGPSPP